MIFIKRKFALSNSILVLMGLFLMSFSPSKAKSFNVLQPSPSSYNSHKGTVSRHKSKKFIPYKSKHSRRKAFLHTAKARIVTQYLPVDSDAIKNEKLTVIDPDTLGHIYYSKIFDIPIDSSANIKLFQTVENWIGTPYKLGGSSHWGIDCSQFAKKVYFSLSNSFIGQTCREIKTRVLSLSQIQLKPGDFVFFKIHGPSVSHMGVYLGNNKFVHSSSSKGVMISDLTSPYFQKRFISGGRAIDHENASEILQSILH